MDGREFRRRLLRRKAAGEPGSGPARPISGTTRATGVRLRRSCRIRIVVRRERRREESRWADQSAIRHRNPPSIEYQLRVALQRRGPAAVPPGGREDRQWPGAGTAVVRPPLVVLRLQRHDGCRTESPRPDGRVHEGRDARRRRGRGYPATQPRLRSGAASATSISRTCRSGRSRPWATCCRCCG